MRTVIALTCMLTAIATPSQAKQALNVEITPLIGYRFGGNFHTQIGSAHKKVELNEETSYGLLTAWSFDKKRQGELLISHYNSSFSQSDDFSASNKNLGVTYAHIGGNVPILKGPIPFYVTGGFGLTHLAPKDSALSNETHLSVNVGLASKIALTENMSLRVDSRLYGTFFNSDSSIFCDVEACAIYVSSDIWVQSEVSVGITYRF